MARGVRGLSGYERGWVRRYVRGLVRGYERGYVRGCESMGDKVYEKVCVVGYIRLCMSTYLDGRLEDERVYM